MVGAGAAVDKNKKELGGECAFNYSNTPFDLVIEQYQNISRKTVLPDSEVEKSLNQTITFKSLPGQTFTDEEQLKVIEMLLEMRGIHLEPYGEKFMRAVPRANAGGEGIPIVPDDAEITDGGRVISRLIKLKYVSYEEMQKALEGFKSKTGKFIAFERINAILVIDAELNIARMLEIVKSIDVKSPIAEQVFVKQIRNASAQEIAERLQKIVEESQKELQNAGKGVNNAQNQQNNRMPMDNRLRRGNQQQQQPQPTAPQNQLASISDADRGMIRGKVLILADERSNKLIIVTSDTNMKFFDKVIEQLDIETTPDTVVKVYRLKYAEAEEVSDMINDLIGNAPSSKSSSKGATSATAKKGSDASLTTKGGAQAKASSNKRTGEAKAGELSKDNTTVLADKRINGLVVMTSKELVPVLENIIDSMDVKLSQVLIETVIIEVTLGDDLKTGIDWVQNGRYRTEATRERTGDNGLPVYRFYDADAGIVREFESADGETPFGSDIEGSWVKFGDALTETYTKLVKGNEAGMFTGNAGYANLIGGGANGGSAAADLVKGVSSNLFGSAINYVFKSDKLNLSAIINATKTDSRAKYLASPVIMTVDNKEATIDATESRKFFSGYETSSSYSTYMRTPKYDSKDIGIKIKVTPKINPNGTVMLNIEEEYSQLGAGQSILVGEGSQKEIIDTALTRKMSADALLENMQTVVLTGLTETYTSDQETGIPILKDIPWIGKWLFGSVSHSESRKELLVFMTPYVLDDGESAQAEALRRKEALSDSRPWNDNGWSKSKLADPVSKREQLRKLKDKWSAQDEDRKAQIAIEKAKVDRVKELEKIDEEESRLWLEVHQQDMNEEDRASFEELREKSEKSELRDLANEIRERKLKDAERSLKDAEKAESEREAEEEARLKSVEAESETEAEAKAEAKESVSVEAVESSAEPASAAPPENPMERYVERTVERPVDRPVDGQE